MARPAERHARTAAGGGLSSTLPASTRRARLAVHAWGVVQGVGFRPFVHRLAGELGLAGWVRNDLDGLAVEAEGPPEALSSFLTRLTAEAPTGAILYALDHRWLDPVGATGFEIRASEAPGDAAGAARAWVLPDLGTCPACRAEIFDPANRRAGHPFSNCTHCGPRYSILRELPYDRPNTAMAGFEMCPACRAEYEDPADRRFHAQPNACPDCGPHLGFEPPQDAECRCDGAVIDMAVAALRRGRIVALKGLGGYQLLVDAGDAAAVARLRDRKRRPTKPFAVMLPDLVAVRRLVDVDETASMLLVSGQAPILLLTRTGAGRREIAESVAPGTDQLGVFLPYTPLHHLLLARLGRPLVATSANPTGEPMVVDEVTARERLGEIADAFVHHDRPVERPVDDSVGQLIRGPDGAERLQLLRRARGYAPLPVLAPRDLPPLLALGGHLNVTVGISREREVILSQHLGDMETPAARSLLAETVDKLPRLFRVTPERVVCDLHPDYHTTMLAGAMGLPVTRVQHHHAHLAAAQLEHELDGPVLALTWDGTGYGVDGTVWGGEVLLGDAASFTRVGTLVPFRLPGGERAAKEPWRTALSLVSAAFEGEVPPDLALVRGIPDGLVAGTRELLSSGIAMPVTTSVGRLFDGVAAILGLAFRNTHQAEAPQQLEFAARRAAREVALPLPLTEVEEILRLDWRPLIRALTVAVARGEDVAALAAGFHGALARAAAELATHVGEERVVLTGGVFANRTLTESLLARLETRGLRGYAHHQLPPTDGSLAAGQLWVAANGGGSS